MASDPNGDCHARNFALRVYAVRRSVFDRARFRIEHHGSVCLIVPLCASGRAWLDEHLGKDNGFQPYWPTAIVEPRYLKEIITGIRRDGLVAR